jgi:hypothetical protein
MGMLGVNVVHGLVQVRGLLEEAVRIRRSCPGRPIGCRRRTPATRPPTAAPLRRRRAQGEAATAHASGGGEGPGCGGHYHGGEGEDAVLVYWLSLGLDGSNPTTGSGLRFLTISDRTIQAHTQPYPNRFSVNPTQTKLMSKKKKKTKPN